MTEEEIQEAKIQHQRWVYLFWFCVGIISFGCLILLLLLFAPIPEDNQRHGDIILGFITGSMITGAIGYLLGGNPLPPKKETIHTINTEGSNVLTENDTVTLKKENE